MLCFDYIGCKLNNIPNSTLTTMIRKFLFLALLGSLPLLYSCDKLKGDVGPAGPQGETGVAGPKGEKGEPGSGGGGGALQFTRDTLSTNANGTFGLGFTLTQENAKAIEKGVILVYAKSNNLWFPLPGLVIFDQEATEYTFAYQVEKLVLSVLVLERAEKPKVRKFQSVRIVVVPASNGRLNAEVDYKNYGAVRQAFNLPE